MSNSSRKRGLKRSTSVDVKRLLTGFSVCNPEEELARAQHESWVVSHGTTEAKEGWIEHDDLLHLVGRWEAIKIAYERVAFEYDRRISLNMLKIQANPFVLHSFQQAGPCQGQTLGWLLSNSRVHMDCARQALVAGRFGKTTNKIVKGLTNFWTACAEIREDILLAQVQVRS